MARAMNFNAGPAALPVAALERAQKELLDIGGTGMSVMEHSHRGKAYEAVHNEAIGLVRELLSVPENYDILLLQGGASQQFAVVPMNLLPAGKSAAELPPVDQRKLTDLFHWLAFGNEMTRAARVSSTQAMALRPISQTPHSMPPFSGRCIE